MEIFKVIALIPTNHLGHHLKQFEKNQIPYNVELSKERIPAVARNGDGMRSILLEGMKDGVPRKVGILTEILVQHGYSAKSVNNVVHTLKKEKFIKATKLGYVIVKESK